VSKSRRLPAPHRISKSPVTSFKSDRPKAFSTGELTALVFRLDVAETVEPLTPEAAPIRQELIDELSERCAVNAAKSAHVSHCQAPVRNPVHRVGGLKIRID
jgi:hypothetical protein